MNAKIYLGKIVVRLMIFALLAALIIVLMGFFTMQERLGVNVSAKEANRKLYQKFEIPESALNINYRSNIQYSLVEFSIEENLFLDWCNNHGWKTSAITPESPGIYRSATSEVQEARVLNDGVKIVSGNDKFEYNGAFDRKLRRVSIVFMSK